MKKINLNLLMAVLVMVGFASCKPNGPTTVAVTSVTVNPTSIELKVGATSKLTATVTPNDATNQKVTWTSSNVSVATVDASGTVTAVAEGTATITVTTEDGKKTATCQVTVVKNVQEVKVVKMEQWQFGYYGDKKRNDGTHIWRFTFCTEGSYDFEKKKPKTDGYLYSFVISSDAPDEKLHPAFGEYILSDKVKNKLEKGTLDKNESFIQHFLVSTGDVDGGLIFLTEGTFVIAKGKMTFEGKGTNDSVYKLLFEAEDYTVTDYRPKPHDPWGKEPQEKTVIEKQFTKANLTIYKMSTCSAIDFTTQAEAGEQYVGMRFWLDKGETALKPGKYIVKKETYAGLKGDPFTISQSEGSTKTDGLTRSFLAVSNGKGFYQKDKPVYFIVSGEATVTDKDITFEGQSYFGSTIKFTYTGDMTAYPPNQ